MRNLITVILILVLVITIQSLTLFTLIYEPETVMSVCGSEEDQGS